MDRCSAQPLIPVRCGLDIDWYGTARRWRGEPGAGAVSAYRVLAVGAAASLAFTFLIWLLGRVAR